MSRFTALLFVLLAGSCCRQPVGLAGGEFDERGTGDSLQALPIPVGQEYLGEYPVLVAGDRILMGNPGKLEKNFSVYLFSGDSLRKEGEFLSRGRGPCEMMHADLSFDPATRQFGMLALMNRENRFCRVRPDADAGLFDLSTWEYRTLPFVGNYSLGASCLVEGSVYLTLGHHADSLSMFSLLDIDGERVVPLNFDYPAVPIELSPMQQGILWGGRLYKHPLKKRFIYSAQDFKYLFLFDLEEGGRMRAVRFICDRLPEVHAVNDWSRPFSFDDSCEDGCFPIAVDERYVYVGYTQQTYGRMRKLMSSGAFLPRGVGRINVYDWDGNFVRRLVLDRPVTGPMVIFGDRLIALSADPLTAEEELVQYSL